MGNSSRSRLSEGQLRQIYFWARDEIGPRAPIEMDRRRGRAGGVTYGDVTNNGVQGRGDRGGLDDQPDGPADTTVVAATGADIQGTCRRRPMPSPRGSCRAAPQDQESSASALQGGDRGGQANLRGDIRTGPNRRRRAGAADVSSISPAPLWLKKPAGARRQLRSARKTVGRNQFVALSAGKLPLMLVGRHCNDMNKAQ